MAKLAISATAIALLFVSALAQAAGHSDVDAQIQKLQNDKKILSVECMAMG